MPPSKEAPHPRNQQSYYRTSPRTLLHPGFGKGRGCPVPGPPASPLFMPAPAAAVPQATAPARPPDRWAGGPGPPPPFPPSVCAIPLKVPGSRLRETEYSWFPTFPAAGPAAAPFFKERGPRGPSALPSSAGAAEAVALLMAPPPGSRRAYVLTVSAQGLGPCYRALFFPRPSARAIAAPDSTTSDVLPLCTALTE